VCVGQPSGGLCTREGVLCNPVAYALVVDAWTHYGFGSCCRVASSCEDIVALGLSLACVLEIEASIPLALLDILAYQPRALSELAIVSYAP
jgi:hypothetical protein